MCKIIVLFAMTCAFASQSQAMTLLEKYQSLKPGQWVKFNAARGSSHYLLVAGRDGDQVTIEEKITETGFTKSWTQRVINLKTKELILLRDKNPIDNTIKEYSDIRDSELEKILKIKFTPVGEKTVTRTVGAGTFKCREYSGVYDGDSIKILYSEKIPLYPIKIVIYKLSKEIRLRAYGEGAVSQFFPTQPPQKILEKTEDANDTGKSGCPKKNRQ